MRDYVVAAGFSMGAFSGPRSGCLPGALGLVWVLSQPFRAVPLLPVQQQRALQGSVWPGLKRISRLLQVPRLAASPVIRFKMLIEPLCALSRVIPSQKLSIAFAACTTHTSRLQTSVTLKNIF